jgi:hypothetical protein
MKMIRILGCFLLVFFSLSLQAQDVSYRKNTIYKDGKPYAYLYKKGSAWAKHYSFQNLKNQELISIKPISKKIGGDYDYIYYEVVFKGLNLKTELQDDDDLARRLAYEFAQFNVLENDKLNQEAVLKFLEKYPAKRFSSFNFIAE